MTSESDFARIHPPGANFGFWEAADGQRLRTMNWLQADPSQGRGHLLFANGRGDFIEKYLETYAHWHQAGWNVTAFDWRGQGFSRGKQAPENPESFDSLAQDLAAFISDWHAGSRDKGPFVAIGHSMGGHLLLRTLADGSPSLGAAVLIAPMLGVNSAPIPDWLGPDFSEFMCLIGFRTRPMWKTAKTLSLPGSHRQGLLTHSRQRYEDELWWWKQFPEIRLGVPTWGWIRAAYRSASESFTHEKLSRVKLPVLLVGTDSDRLVSPTAIRRVNDILPRSELLMFPDCAHEILREEDLVRNKALERIDNFLAVNSP